MPENSEPITTAADHLVRLVNELKEVSFADASKKLNVPVKTIEAWATFLEEEGVLDIKYKFTTPFITVHHEKKGKAQDTDFLFKEKLNNAEITTKLTKLDDVFGKAQLQSNLGEFGLMKSTYSNLFSDISDLSNRIVPALSKFDKERTDKIKKRIAELQLKLQQANSLVNSRQFDQASSHYNLVHNELKILADQVKNLHEFVQKKQKEENQNQKNTEMMVREAYEFLNIGKVDEAKEIYKQLHSVYSGLSREFEDKKVHLENELLKLNKDLSSTIDKTYISNMQQGSNQINELLSIGTKSLKQGKVQIAEESYKTIKKVFESLPPGFIKQKKTTEEKILKFYNDLSIYKEKQALTIYKDIRKNLDLLMKMFSQNLSENNTDEALNIYAQMKAEFSRLPKGFLKEKTRMQNQILQNYEALSVKLENKFATEFNSKAQRLGQLLDSMKASIKQGNFDAAQLSYKDIKKMYNSLPEGFIQQKTAIQNEIVKASEALVSRSTSSEEKYVMDNAKALEKMIDTAMDMLKKGKKDEAQQLYDKIEKSYHKLPSGFLYKKSQIREKILLLYKQLAVHYTGIKQTGQPKMPTVHMDEPAKQQTSRPDKVEPQKTAANPPLPKFPDANKDDAHIKEMQDKISKLKSIAAPKVKVQL